MSVEKAEVRAGAMHEVGVRMDDLLEAVKADVHRFDGAASGLLQCVKAIEGLLAHVDKDVDEGKYDLEVAKVAKQYIARAVQVAQNLGQQSSNQKILSIGKVQMGEAAVATVKKMHQVETGRAETLARVEQTPEDDVDLRSRTAGARPPMTIKEQRLAEEKPVPVKRTARRKSRSNGAAHD